MSTEAKWILLTTCFVFILALIIVIALIAAPDADGIERHVAKVILNYKERGILK